MRLTTQELDRHGRTHALTLKPLVRAIPRDCYRLSAWRAWGTLARQLSVIALLAWATSQVTVHGDWRALLELPALAALWCLQGAAFTGIYILGHDCGHYAFSRRRWVNDALGQLIMSSLIASYTAWKLVHNQHHVWSNVREKDVGWHDGLKTRAELVKASRGERLVNWMAYESPVGLLIGAWLMRPKQFQIQNGSMHQFPTVTARDARALRRSLLYIALCTGSILVGLFLWGGMWAVVSLYLAPAFVGAALGGLLILMQHSSEDALVFDPAERTPFRSQVVGTYDTRFPRLFEWLVLDVNIHLVHHLTPRVPWYNLRRATAAVKAEFPECVQERRFSLSLLRQLWAHPAIERHPEGYYVRVALPQEPSRAPTPALPESLLGSRA